MKIEEIKNPKFLKKMSIRDMEKLSNEIRKFIIESVSKTGGHLSSNLGIVDLTIALHKIYDSPKDKIIFDVGHQAYTHKILTGRAKDFKNLRQYKGLSGFQKRNESIHDIYEAGHSSTSLSAALGFALARDMNKQKGHVIAVIGDGSIGNGLAYEALNHIGEGETNIIVILNDNEMSISKNVGALHNTFDKLRATHGYSNAKRGTKKVLNKIPLIGKPLCRLIENIKRSLKKLYLKDGFLFEEFGFKYYGPINGHDYNEMLTYLKMVQKVNGPVLLHVITEKGKGYDYAHNDEIGLWHGVGKFDIETGEMINIDDGLISWSEAICRHLENLAQKNKDIIAITPAMANGAKLKNFASKYPKQFIDVGIAEEHALVLANALACSGKTPFVSMYSTFLQRGYDQILHDIARMDSHVIIGVDRAGLVGDDGETHQGIYDISFLSHIPNMTIMAPKDSIEAGNMLYTAFQYKHPSAIRYSRNKIVYEEEVYQKIPIGSWECLEDGEDATIITYGSFVPNAIKIRETLQKKNINIEIANARFIKPFDELYFRKLLLKNKPIFVYEEVATIGSLGQMLCSYASSLEYKSKIFCFSIKDDFIFQGKNDIILKELELDIHSITSKIYKILKED